MQERISLILKENQLKQREFAVAIGVTESYISALLSGRNRKLSAPLANLIEEKFGYNAQWVLFGELPKIKETGRSQGLSDAHKRAIRQIEKMSDTQIRAVLAFIDSLEKIESCFHE